MKFFALVALVATASAIKIQDPFGLTPECEYHKSEDGLSCVTVQKNCHSTTAVPVMEKCPEIPKPSEKTDTAPKNPELQSSVPEGDGAKKA